MTEMVAARRTRHHKRGPVKRFLLATGPFYFLALAFLLSAGVVEIVEQAPLLRPIPTLAEERAMAASAEPVVEAETAPPSTRIRTLPGTFLSGSDYDLIASSATNPSAQAHATSLDDAFGFPPLAPDDTLEPFGQLGTNPQYLGLK